MGGHYRRHGAPQPIPWPRNQEGERPTCSRHKRRSARTWPENDSNSPHGSECPKRLRSDKRGRSDPRHCWEESWRSPSCSDGPYAALSKRWDEPQVSVPPLSDLCALLQTSRTNAGGTDQLRWIVSASTSGLALLGEETGGLFLPPAKRWGEYPGGGRGVVLWSLLV